MNDSYLVKFLFFLILTSCSGYHFKNKNNPFAAYEIQSLSVPMFVNWSVVPEVSGPMTSSFISLLMNYSNLSIYSRENTKADGILVGIINSEDKMKKVYKNKSYQATVGDLHDSIKERRDFYIPQETSFSLSLRLILIKSPNSEDYYQTIKNDPHFALDKSKIIFDEIIPLNATISRTILPDGQLKDGGDVNFTKNHKAQNDAVLAMIKDATEKFKKEIIDAF